MNKRAETNYQTLIIAMLLGGLAIAGVNFFLSGFSTGYDAEFTDQATLDNLNKYDNISSTLDRVQEVITTDEDQGLIERTVGVIDAVFSSGYTAFRLLIGIPGQYFTTVQVALTAIGIPAEVARVALNIIFAVILAIALLVIIEAVTRVR